VLQHPKHILKEIKKLQKEEGGGPKPSRKRKSDNKR
jgi:hypothetical protein